MHRHFAFQGTMFGTYTTFPCGLLEKGSQKGFLNKKKGPYNPILTNGSFFLSYGRECSQGLGSRGWKPVCDFEETLLFGIKNVLS